MVRVFCNKRGSGKTKNLIKLANQQLNEIKGESVYIDDDSRYIRQVDRRIRFVATDEFNIKSCESFYGLLCGLVSENYDIENIYIDGLLNITSCSVKDTAYLFRKIIDLSKNFKINIYMNINNDQADVPEFIKEYVA